MMVTYGSKHYISADAAYGRKGTVVSKSCKAPSTILFLCGLMIVHVPRANAQEWRKIVPLKSTRSDVERLLGPNERSYGVVYELTEGVLFIEYSSGPCKRKARWLERSRRHRDKLQLFGKEQATRNRPEA